MQAALLGTPPAYVQVVLDGVAGKFFPTTNMFLHEPRGFGRLSIKKWGKVVSSEGFAEQTLQVFPFLRPIRVKAEGILVKAVVLN